jgi:hypothetical protein
MEKKQQNGQIFGLKPTGCSKTLLKWREKGEGRENVQEH